MNKYTNAIPLCCFHVIGIIYRKRYEQIFIFTECRQVPGCKKAGPAGPALLGVIYSRNDGFGMSKTLTEVIIPNSITKIGDSAFNHCENLAKVVIPESVTTLGSGVFQYCYGIKSVGPVGSGASVEIPYTLTSTGKHMFHECKYLETAVIPYTIKNLQKVHFLGVQI